MKKMLMLLSIVAIITMSAFTTKPVSELYVNTARVEKIFDLYEIDGDFTPDPTWGQDFNVATYWTPNSFTATTLQAVISITYYQVGRGLHTTQVTDFLYYQGVVTGSNDQIYTGIYREVAPVNAIYQSCSLISVEPLN